MDKVQEKPYSEIELDFSLDNNGKYILSYKTVIAELLTLLLPEEFFGMDLNEIADKYIPSSDANPDRVKLEKEEVDTVEGKKQF